MNGATFLFFIHHEGFLNHLKRSGSHVSPLCV